MNLLYRNWNQNQKSIFHELEILQPESIVSVLGANFLSVRYFMKFGDRQVPEKLQSMSNKEVAEIIAGVFSQRWTKLYDLSEVIAYFTDFDSETTIEETNLDSFTKNILSDNTDKVTAFDSEVLTTDGASDNSISETNEQDKRKLFTKKDRDIVNVDIRRRMIDNSNIHEIICDDVVSIVGLQIY